MKSEEVKHTADEQRIEMLFQNLYNELAEKKSQLSSLQEQNEKLKQEYSDFTQAYQLKQSETVNALYKELSSLQEDLLQETGKCMKYQHQIAQLQETNERLNKVANDLVTEKVDLSLMVDELREENEELSLYKHSCNESIAHLDREVARLREALNEIEELQIIGEGYLSAADVEMFPNRWKQLIKVRQAKPGTQLSLI